MPSTAVVRIPVPSEISKIGYGDEKGRAPEPQGDEVVVMDEPGRAFSATGPHLWGVCYSSHYFRVFAEAESVADPKITAMTRLVLAVRHGSGVERFTLGSRARTLLAAIQDLPSDIRYSALQTIFDAASTAARAAADKTRADMSSAFLDGRLKKRTAGGVTRVLVEPKPISAAAPAAPSHA